MSRKAEQAVLYKHSGCNCCQAVIKALCDDEKLLAAGAGFAVGMGSMQATCGALIGAVMAAGEKTGGRGTLSLSKRMFADFKGMCGATVCAELKGIATGKALCDCDSCVRNAVTAFENVTGGVS